MNSRVSKERTAVSDKNASIVTGVIFILLGAAGVVFSIVWLLPQTIALPVQFPKEHGFRFFNGAIAAYAIVALALMLMGYIIVRRYRQKDSFGAIRALQLAALVATVACILLMIGAPLIYNLFLGIGLFPLGMALMSYTCVHGFPRISESISWKSLTTGIAVVLLPAIIVTGYTMYSYLDYSIRNDKFAVATDFKEFKAECLDGTQLDQSYFSKRKLTMINCWETICGPCIREMPYLEKIYEEQSDDEFTIISICADCISGGTVNEATVANAREIAAAGITYPIVIPSPELEKGIIGDISAFPTTFFVDSKGNVIKTVLGSKEKKEWEAIIEECRQQVR